MLHDSQMSQDTSKRQKLRVAIKLMVAIGLLAFVALLMSSMSNPDSVSTAVPAMLVETSGIDEGEVEYTVWHGRPVLIYKRSVEDLQALQLATQSLADPESEQSHQPELPYPQLRSLTPEWFVAFSSGTDMGCPIELRPAGGGYAGQLWLGGFADTCGGSVYDLAGRVFSGQQARENLAVPPYKIKPNGDILLGGR